MTVGGKGFIPERLLMMMMMMMICLFGFLFYSLSLIHLMPLFFFLFIYSYRVFELQWRTPFLIKYYIILCVMAKIIFHFGTMEGVFAIFPLVYRRYLIFCAAVGYYFFLVAVDGNKRC